MAFKILSSSELELLTENQRINYEKELNIYNERVKFVEQIEKFENVVITPYEPKLIGISAVSKAPEKIYSNPKIVVKPADIIVKPMLKIKVASFDKPVKAVLPKHSKIENISISYKNNFEYIKPILSPIRKAVAPTNTFTKFEQVIPVLPSKIKTVVPTKVSKKIEQVRPNLPTAVKLQSFAELAFTPVLIDKEAIKIINPNIMLPTINLSALTLSEKKQPNLPHLSVNFSEIKAFKSPDKMKIALPKAIIPKQVNISFKQENKTKAQLPKVPNISIVDTSFRKPNIQKAKVPIYKKVIIPENKFNQIKNTLSDFYNISKPKVDIKLYTAPEVQKANLPTFTKPVITSELYFKPLVDNTPKIEYPPINVIAVKPFKKVYSKISSFPSVSSVNVPNAYENEFLKNLLPSNKENNNRKGVLA